MIFNAMDAKSLDILKANVQKKKAEEHIREYSMVLDEDVSTHVTMEFFAVEMNFINIFFFFLGGGLLSL